MAEKFRLDTDDILGFSYQEYINKQRGLAISNPSAYFTLRANVMKRVKRDAVGALYKTIFNALSLGQDAKEQPLDSTNLGSSSSIPKYPSNLINDIAISISASLASSLDQVVDILLPNDFDKIATSKLTVKAGAKTIDEVVSKAIEP